MPDIPMNELFPPEVPQPPKTVGLDSDPISDKIQNRNPHRPNREVRPREYLTEEEVGALAKAARKVGRHKHRDATMIMVAYRHGLRAAELVVLEWSQVEFDPGESAAACMHIARVKHGTDAVHPLAGDEVRALRRLKRQCPGRYLFASEPHGGHLSDRRFHQIVARAGLRALIPFPVHPHMLRHACGFKLANDGHDTRLIQAYLGHRSIRHTVRYTELAPGRFDGLWEK